MKFWDASAIVPLLMQESTSEACREILRSDEVQLVWCLTPVELASALWRRHRLGAIPRKSVLRAESAADRLARHWIEIDEIAPVREVADHLVRAHPLGAADALQLAAAIVGFDESPRGRGFVALDRALLRAAASEGFEPIRPG